MDLICAPTLRATAFLFQPKLGAHALTIVAKLTFDLLPVVCSLSAVPDEIQEEETHWDDDPRRSLSAPSDVAPFKIRAEVLLVGSAFAPGGKPVRSLKARLQAAGMDKVVEVHGSRLFGVNGELRGGASWTKMPLRYERAAGGPDTWNPVGVWLDGPKDPYGQRHLPNLQPEGAALLEVGQFVAPTGFGPISGTWPSRVELLRGRTDIKSPRTARSVPIGDDFEGEYFQDAPLDQQVPDLRPDESISLENLHAKHATLVTRLPGLRPRANVEIQGRVEDVSLRADTLWIDTDRNRCTLTFRGQIAVDGAAAVRIVRVTLKDAEGRKGRALTKAMVAPGPLGARAMTGVERTDLISLPLAPAADTASAQAAQQGVFLQEPTTDDLAPDTSSWGHGAFPSQSASDDEIPEVKETTAVQGPADAIKADLTLPFQAPKRLPAPTKTGLGEAGGAARPASVAPPPAVAVPPLQEQEPPLVRANTLMLEKERPPEAERRQATQEFQLPAGKLAGPAWLAAQQAKAAGDGSAVEALLARSAPPQAPPPPVSPAPVMPPAPAMLSKPPADLGLGALSATTAALSTPTLTPAQPDRVRLGDVDVQALASAARVGVVSASNAAAGAATPKKEATPALEAKPENKPETSYLELLSFERTVVPRLRAHDVYSTWMRPIPKPAPMQQGKPPPPPPTQEALEKLDRESVYAVLGKDPDAPAAEGKSGSDANAKKAAHEDDESEAPLVLAQGALSFAFEHLDILKTAVALAKPLGTADKKLKEALDLAAELLGSGLESDDGVDAITARIRESWARVVRAQQPTQLDAKIAQKLLEQRKYQKRTVLDGEWIRALLTPPSGESVVAYLPMKLEKRLPLFARFPVKLLAELYPQQDPGEESTSALKVVALARVATKPKLGK